MEIETLPENPYQTLTSFLFDLSEDIPDKGSEYVYHTIDEILDDEGNLTSHRINMIFTVTDMDGRKVTKVKLKIKYLDINDKQQPEDEEAKN